MDSASSSATFRLELPPRPEPSPRSRSLKDLYMRSKPSAGRLHRPFDWAVSPYAHCRNLVGLGLPFHAVTDQNSDKRHDVVLKQVKLLAFEATPANISDRGFTTRLMPLYTLKLDTCDYGSCCKLPKLILSPAWVFDATTSNDTMYSSRRDNGVKSLQRSFRRLDPP